MSIPLPAKFTFLAWAGGTFRKRLTLLQGDDDSAPRDITGCTAVMTIRVAPRGTVLFTLNTTGSGITLGGAAGTIDLYISATDTLSFDGWASPSAIYDLSITDTSTSGDTEPLLWGVFRVEGVA